MRITNKIMRNNSLYNLNQNKILEDKLTNQMTNQSKIARPSDDPVVAIRALRLRSSVTSVTQYHEKNAADADQWLSVTADALTTVDEILKDLYEKATSASNKDLTADDLDIILTQMKSLTQEFYSSGNVDYAGRYVFSGFRTDTAITFSAEDIENMKKHPVSYNITQNFKYSDIDSFNFTDYDVLSPDNAINNDGMRADGTSYEQDITNTKLYRIRLAYDSLDSGSGDPIESKLTFGSSAGTPTITEFSDAEEAYRAVSDPSFDGIAYIPSTGELVFSQAYYDKLKEEDTFTISYDKSFVNDDGTFNWKEGDINPVHYFECVETRNYKQEDEKKVIYNTEVTTLPQDIYYDVGFNQKIQVNSVASEVFTHNVQRDMDDLRRGLEQLHNIETKISDIKKKMADYPEDSDDYKNLTKQLEAAEKAQTYIRENVHTQFENQITKYQDYLDDNNIAITNNAARGSRLELITTRLMNQQATFKDLQTDNESIDVTQVAVELSSSELTYQAALMATAKVMQTNLMNYI